MDFASGDGAHRDFVRDLVSDVVDRARRGCHYFWTGRLGVAPDERTEAAKACAAAAVHRHRVTASRSSTSHHHHTWVRGAPSASLASVTSTTPLISYDHCKMFTANPTKSFADAREPVGSFTCLLFPPSDYK